MSTDPARSTRSDAVPGRGTRRRARRWRRQVLVVLGVAAVLAGGLGVASANQGPRLDSVRFGTGDRLALTADQAVAAITPDQVRVEPAAAFDVVTAGADISIRFTEPLRYGSGYEVQVRDVTALYTGTRADLDARFTTPQPDVAVLRRDAAGDDAIVSASLLDGTPAAGDDGVLYRAPRIQTFARLDAGLAVVTLGDDGVPALAVIGPDGVPQPIALPPGTTGLRDLDVEPGRGLVGAIVSGPDLADQLVVADLADGTGVAEPVGDDPTIDWRFVPRTTSLVRQATDTSLLLVDVLAPDTVTPLGQHLEMRDFVAGGTTLIAADIDRVTAIDLGAASSETIALAAPDLPGDEPTLPTVVIVDDSGGYIAVAVRIDYVQSAIVDAQVVEVTDGSTRVLYTSPSPEGRITGVCVSPNGEYVAVQTVSGEGVDDGYPAQPLSTASTVVFVSRVDGRIARSTAGVLPDWCAGR